MATFSIPTTCFEIPLCGSETKTGTILIRPFIAPLANHPCERVPTTDFPANVAISESLLKVLEANNFDKAKVFSNGGDPTKWNLAIIIKTNCEEECTEDHSPQKYMRFFVALSDFDIVPINTSGTPGFAIKLTQVPVSDLPKNKKRSLAISIGLKEPCSVHTCTSCSPAVNRFQAQYSAGTTATNVIDGEEIRVQLIGGIGTTNCDTCK